MYVHKKFMPQRINYVFGYNTLKNRVNCWKDSTQMIKDKIWIGWGIGAYKSIFPKIYQKHNMKKETLQAHNEYIQLLCETGVIGILSFLIFLFFYFFTFYIKFKENQNPSEKFLMVLFLSMTINIMIDSVFSFPFHLALTANNAIIFAAIPISINKKDEKSSNAFIIIIFSFLCITTVLLNMFIGLNGYRSEVFIKKGLNEVKQKNYIVADKYFKTSVKQNPFNGYALFLQGTNTLMVIENESKYSKSLSLLKKSLKYRDFGSLHFSVAYNYFKLNRIEQCKEELIKAEKRGYKKDYFRIIE